MPIAESSLALEIARTAARLVVEDGLELGRAKRRALELLGAPARTPLPDKALLDEAIREHIALFCADTQPEELRALRALALHWMERLAQFRPHLGGAVWQGTATRHSDIYLQLFCDDPKSAEIALIEQGVGYTPTTVKGLHGRPVEALGIALPGIAGGERVGLHLIIYDLDDLRGALRGGSDGRAPRGGIAAVRQLLLESLP
ncbi:MAG: hypothetical protein M9919_02180 [Burkholderiaceae bacterium]|jgi:hypothetical protein|nr:hypothetical protein [Burkholderiaceae bacterium]